MPFYPQKKSQPQGVSSSRNLLKQSKRGGRATTPIRDQDPALPQPGNTKERCKEEKGYKGSEGTGKVLQKQGKGR